MFRYKLHSPGGDSLGDATYACRSSRRGIHLGAGKRFRVLEVVPFEEADELGFMGMLKVEAISDYPGISDCYTRQPL